MRQRKDWRIGRLHIIKRGYPDEPEYGFLLWNKTLDVWCGRTLFTFRWVKYV